MVFNATFNNISVTSFDEVCGVWLRLKTGNNALLLFFGLLCMYNVRYNLMLGLFVDGPSQGRVIRPCTLFPFHLRHSKHLSNCPSWCYIFVFFTIYWLLTCSHQTEIYLAYCSQDIILQSFFFLNSGGMICFLIDTLSHYNQSPPDLYFKSINNLIPFQQVNPIITP